MATVTNSTVRRDIDSVTRPDPLTYAPKILCWILFWPWNLAWSVCVNNPFRYMLQFIVKVIRSTFEEISSGEFKKIEAELSLDPPPIPAGTTSVKSQSAAPTYTAPSIASSAPAIERATVDQATVDQANLERANLERANLERANLERATVVNVMSAETKQPQTEDKPDSDTPASVTISEPSNSETSKTSETTAPVTETPNANQLPSSADRSDNRWRDSKVEDVENIVRGNRLVEDNAAVSSETTAFAESAPSKTDNADVATSAATPDPLLYIKHDSTDLPLYKSMQFSKEANPDDPWLAKPDSN